ncbi:MAG: NAD(P)-dependent oxidoreductase [Roseburia sp.]|nr:NAD(P)-dependent oxidoreductase [Roseburia sp.]
MERVILTGGTGFIGSWLVEELISHETEVVVLVRSLEKAERNQLFQNKHVRLVEYYSRQYEDMLLEKTEADAFYHLAWEGVSTELKNESALQLENIRFSMEMLELAKALGAKRFIATGTVAEYAFSENIMDINGRQTPNDMYGAAKTAVHYMLETRARLLKLPFNWAVVPSTFGEGRRDNNIITYTITSLLRGEKPSFGYLLQMWDFLHVKEVVRALWLIGEKGAADKTYGIGSGVFKPLRDYIVQIRDIINPELPLGIGDIPSLSDKAFSSCVSIYDITKDTGFVPQISFEEGIRRTIPYYKAMTEETPV